jgi:hypothetical protein
MSEPRDPFETALAALAPATEPLRDRVLFAAGQQSARPARFWPLLALGFASLSAYLAWRPAVAPLQEPVTIPFRIATEEPTLQPYVQAPPRQPPQWGHALRSGTDYLSQRDRVLHFGIEAIPMPAGPPPAAGPAAPKLDRQSLLQSI